MPTTLAAIRKQYPQYNDMSDQQLADSLYKKHYSDIPRDKFNQEIGLAPPPSPTPPPSMNVLQQYGHDFMEANRRSGSELAESLHQFVTPPKSLSMQDQLHSRFLNAGPVVEAAINRIGDPIIAPYVTAFGRPVETLTHGAIKKEDVGNLAAILIPGAGEVAGERLAAAEVSRLAKARGISTAQAAAELKAARSPARVPKLPEVAQPKNAAQAAHQQRADQLTQEGVDLTVKQREGGLAKSREDRAATGSPYVGAGIQQARQRTLETFNRATYNRALAPIGERLDVNSPVGHEGVAEVHRRLDAAYTKVLQGASAANDTKFQGDMGGLVKKVAHLPKSERDEFAHIIKTEVTQRFSAARGTPSGRMTGNDFKLTESELERIAATYKASTSGRERELGRYLEEAAGYLRDSVERNSPAPVIKQLKNVDTGWANLKRIEQAAAAAGRNDGLFTAGQLVDAVKAPVGVPSRTRRAAFARGRALLQDFAQNAHAVTGSKVPDPGTAAQLKTGLFGKTIGTVSGGMLGQLFGHNPLTSGAGAALGYGIGGPIDDFIAHLTNERAARNLTGQMSPVVNRALASPRLRPRAVIPAAGVVSETERAGQRNP